MGAQGRSTDFPSRRHLLSDKALLQFIDFSVQVTNARVIAVLTDEETSFSMYVLLDGRKPLLAWLAAVVNTTFCQMLMSLTLSHHYFFSGDFFFFLFSSSRPLLVSSMPFGLLIFY